MSNVTFDALRVANKRTVSIFTKHVLQGFGLVLENAMTVLLCEGSSSVECDIAHVCERTDRILTLRR